MKTSDSLPILHGSNISPYVRKVRVALAFKAIEYRGIQQSPFNASDEFKAKSPLSKIPCWEDGDLVLPDSSVIVGYLEHRHPSPSLFPDNPEERARALWFEEYADTKVGETVAAVFFQRVVRPNVLKQKIDSKHDKWARSVFSEMQLYSIRIYDAMLKIKAHSHTPFKSVREIESPSCPS